MEQMGLNMPSLVFEVSALQNPLADWMINKLPLIDVRAPVEFREGHIPGSVNLPILTDEERREIGICYKTFGSEAALQRGYELVSGDNKLQKVTAWIRFLETSPNTLVTCFRGGQRSQISQKWMAEAGFPLVRVNGGYKKARQFLIHVIHQFCQTQQLMVVSGKTGSNKTKIIEQLACAQNALDLEKLANHRGSAFGEMDTLQPSQAQFENNLAVTMLQLMRTHADRSGVVYAVEDESRMIGKLTQPESLFTLIRSSPVVLIEDPLEVRTQNIFVSYIMESKIGQILQIPVQHRTEGHYQDVRRTFQKFHQAVQAISRKLGGEKTTHVMKLLIEAEQDFFQYERLELNRLWISELLASYYDPLYLKSLKRRQPQIFYSGSYFEVFSWLENRINKLNDVSANER